jgi:hypothetical protein
MTSILGTTTTRGERTGPTLESLLPSWTRSLRAAGKSANTVSGYLDGVRCFTDFLGELGLSQAVALITREHIAHVRHVLARRRADVPREAPSRQSVRLDQPATKRWRRLCDMTRGAGSLPHRAPDQAKGSGLRLSRSERGDVPGLKICGPA